MLEIVICEDNVQNLSTFYRYISGIISVNSLPGRIVLSCGSPGQVREFLKHSPANVFFLDIDLGAEENGYELAKKIREAVQKPYIVFITGHLEFSLLGYKVRPFDFLPKPVTKDILEKCLLDIHEDYMKSSVEEHPEDDRLTIDSAGKVHFIKKRDIVFIEKFDKVSIIHTTSSNISCYKSLSDFEKLLSLDSSFVRCHKSYIANRNYIAEISMENSEIVFDTGHRCFMGKKYKENLLGGI